MNDVFDIHAERNPNHISDIDLLLIACQIFQDPRCWLILHAWKLVYQKHEYVVFNMSKLTSICQRTKYLYEFFER